MESVKILDELDLRKHIVFMLNNQLNVNISVDNIWLNMRPKQIMHGCSYYIGIKLGSRLPIKPVIVILDPVTITITYIKKNTRGGYEFNEVINMMSYVDATEFSMEESEQK